MKKLIILLAIAGIVSAAKAQTIDTAFHKMTACKIQPIKARFTDADSCTHVGYMATDDAASSLLVNWYLMDDAGAVHYMNTIVLVAGDYANYVTSGRSATWLFTYIANKYTQIQFL